VQSRNVGILIGHTFLWMSDPAFSASEGTKYGCGVSVSRCFVSSKYSLPVCLVQHYKVVSSVRSGKNGKRVLTVVKTRKVRKNDCSSPYCVHSIRHSRNCSDCHCERVRRPGVMPAICAYCLPVPWPRLKGNHHIHDPRVLCLVPVLVQRRRSTSSMTETHRFTHPNLHRHLMTR
jgi:hypothetical protein